MSALGQPFITRSFPAGRVVLPRLGRAERKARLLPRSGEGRDVHCSASAREGAIVASARAKVRSESIGLHGKTSRAKSLGVVRESENGRRAETCREHAAHRGPPPCGRELAATRVSTGAPRCPVRTARPAPVRAGDIALGPPS